MKKLLIIILIVLLVSLLGYIGIQGFSIGPVNVLSIGGIQAKNNDLNSQIEKATKLSSTDYKKALSDIDTSVQKLDKEKKKYEDMVTISTSDEVKTVNQLEKYEVEYLWTKIGNHATSEGVTIKLDITNGTAGVDTQPKTLNDNNTADVKNTSENTVNVEQIKSEAASINTNSNKKYNLNFTVTGAYVGIADFIYAIENDSSLAFKIEQFKMVPSGGTSELKATFVCKDIAIKDITQASSSSSNNQSGNNTNTTNTTNTNSTNTNSANTTNTNTTNTTNTNSTNTTNTTNTNITNTNPTNPNAR